MGGESPGDKGSGERERMSRRNELEEWEGSDQVTKGV